MEMKIDYNRGVTKRREESAGIDVYMYKDQPGIFYNIFGKIVSDKLAAQAGFDVATLGKHRKLREDMALAKATIENELGLGQKTREILKEEGNYRLVALGSGLHNIESLEGDVLNGVQLPLKEAEILWSRLVPESKKIEAAMPQEEKKTASRK